MAETHKGRAVLSEPVRPALLVAETHEGRAALSEPARPPLLVAETQEGRAVLSEPARPVLLVLLVLGHACCLLLPRDSHSKSLQISPTRQLDSHSRAPQGSNTHDSVLSSGQISVGGKGQDSRLLSAQSTRPRRGESRKRLEKHEP